MIRIEVSERVVVEDKNIIAAILANILKQSAPVNDRGALHFNA
jgi:hypothetical protein